MNIVGLETNIGSMLWPFYEKGHNILGATDSRGITKEKEFLANFEKSKWYDTPEELYEAICNTDVDILLAQPSCSKFSPFSRKDKNSYGDFNDLWDNIKMINPRIFFVESKLGFMEEIKFIEGYRYQIEWVHNWGYGNTQKNRNRLWVIGIRNDIDWKFIPNEKPHNNTVETVIGDLPDYDVPELDHIHIYKPLYKNSITKEYLTLDELFEELQIKGKLEYIASDGKLKSRIGRKILDRIYCPTILGSNGIYHYEKKYPLTVRERARLMGFPDNFKFTHKSIINKYKATGKSVPLEFVYEIENQLSNGNNNIKKSKLIPVPLKLNEFLYNLFNYAYMYN
jgi:DNA (cytosine-5)-methyltransferase 1